MIYPKNKEDKPMKILIVEPMRHPRRANIPHTLEEMQRIVGGYIEAVYPYDDPIAVVCAGEGKLNGYALNRSILDKDVIAGTFFVCGYGEEDFTDLSDELADKYEKLFYEPEVFAMTPMGVLVIRANGERVIIQ